MSCKNKFSCAAPVPVKKESFALCSSARSWRSEKRWAQINKTFASARNKYRLLKGSFLFIVLGEKSGIFWNIRVLPLCEIMFPSISLSWNKLAVFSSRLCFPAHFALITLMRQWYTVNTILSPPEHSPVCAVPLICSTLHELLPHGPLALRSRCVVSYQLTLGRLLWSFSYAAAVMSAFLHLTSTFLKLNYRRTLRLGCVCYVVAKRFNTFSLNVALFVQSTDIKEDVAFVTVQGVSSVSVLCLQETDHTVAYCTFGKVNIHQGELPCQHQLAGWRDNERLSCRALNGV